MTSILCPSVFIVFVAQLVGFTLLRFISWQSFHLIHDLFYKTRRMSSGRIITQGNTYKTMQFLHNNLLKG